MRTPSRNRPLPPLHCLLAFEATARNLSLSKAAGELRLSQSAVAQSITLLEERLGLQLVRALLPKVELTPTGERYMISVQSFSHRLRDGLHDGSPVGRTQLRITTSQALGRLWLAPRLARFIHAHPRIDLVVTSTASFQPLTGGGADIGLRYGGSFDPRHIVVPMWTDRLIAVAAPVLANRVTGLAPAAVARALPLIDHPSASWQRWLQPLVDGCEALHARVVLRCTDLHLAIEAACLGMGAVIAPSTIVKRHLESGVLRRISSHGVEGKAYEAVVALQQADRPPVRAFLAWLSEELASDVER